MNNERSLTNNEHDNLARSFGCSECGAGGFQPKVENARGNLDTQLWFLETYPEHHHGLLAMVWAARAAHLLLPIDWVAPKADCEAGALGLWCYEHDRGLSECRKIGLVVA